MSIQETRAKIFLILLEQGNPELIEEYFELADQYSQKLFSKTAKSQNIEKAQA